MHLTQHEASLPHPRPPTPAPAPAPAPRAVSRPGCCLPADHPGLASALPPLRTPSWLSSPWPREMPFFVCALPLSSLKDPQHTNTTALVTPRRDSS